MEGEIKVASEQIKAVGLVPVKASQLASQLAFQQEIEKVGGEAKEVSEQIKAVDLAQVTISKILRGIKDPVGLH